MPSSLSGTAAPQLLTDHAEDLFGAVQKQISFGGTISRKSPLAPYHTAARWVYCGVDLFSDVAKALYAGIDKENPDNYHDQDHDVFQSLCTMIPGLKGTLTEFWKKPEHFAMLANLMGKWADGARNEDTATLKKAIVGYIPLDPSTTAVLPPLLDTKKEERGFNHPMCGRLISPRAAVVKMKGDAKLYEAYAHSVNKGVTSITHVDLPMFLYDEEVPYVESDVEELGLLRGHCLIRAYRCLMTGPSSALSGVRMAAKSSKAEIHELTEATPQTIAYTCVMVRQALSTAQHWTVVDGNFNYQMFYQFILELLKDKDDPWVADIMAFWNNEVPGLQRKSHKRKIYEITQDLVDRHEDLLNTIIACRRNRQRKANQEEEQMPANTEDQEHDEPQDNSDTDQHCSHPNTQPQSQSRSSPSPPPPPPQSPPQRRNPREQQDRAQVLPARIRQRTKNPKGRK